MFVHSQSLTNTWSYQNYFNLGEQYATTLEVNLPNTGNAYSVKVISDNLGISDIDAWHGKIYKNDQLIMERDFGYCDGLFEHIFNANSNDLIRLVLFPESPSRCRFIKWNPDAYYIQRLTMVAVEINIENRIGF